MNYKMMRNHAQACTNPPSKTRIQNKGFFTPIYGTSEISKTMNMLSEHGTTNANVITS